MSDAAAVDVRSPEAAPSDGARRLAVIGPSFFSYVQAVVDTFREGGIEAIALNEKHSERVLAKILYRLGLYRFTLSPKHAHLKRLRADIKAFGATDVLLVNVESIGRAFVERLRADGLRVHIYMWDGVANKPGFVDYLDLLEGRGSFDPEDCERLGLTYIPLFAERAFDVAEQHGDEPLRFDIGFCGTVHSARVRIAAELVTASWAKRRPVALMLYYHSKWLLYLKGLSDRSVWRIRRRVAFKPYSKAEIAAMFAASRFVLDIPHPGQSGMTARTFEVLMSGSRLLTFNRRVAQLIPASLQPRIKIIAEIGDAAEIDFGACGRLPQPTEEERYFLSIQRFVDQLAGMIGIANDALVAGRGTG